MYFWVLAVRYTIPKIDSNTKVVKQAGCKQLALDSAGTVARASSMIGRKRPHGIASANAAAAAATAAAAVEAAAASFTPSSRVLTLIVERYAKALLTGTTTTPTVADSPPSFNPWTPEVVAAADVTVMESEASPEGKKDSSTSNETANVVVAQNEQHKEDSQATYEAFRRQAHLFPFVLLRFWRPTSANIVSQSTTEGAGATPATAAVATTAGGAVATANTAAPTIAKDAATGRFYEVYLPRLPTGLHLDVFSDETVRMLPRAYVSARILYYES